MTALIDTLILALGIAAVVLCIWAIARTKGDY
jgi:hypothetical protein